MPTLTTLATSASTAVLGQTVTLTATVTAVPASAGTPSSGSVTFLDGTTTLGSPATLNSSGVATLQVSTLPAGSDALTASYGGTSGFAASQSVIVPNSVITTVAGDGL